MEIKQGYHFLGIGGIGMSALAHCLLDSQERISGLDTQESRSTKQLVERGAHVFFDKASNAHCSYLRKAKTIVYSTAIPPSHPSRKMAEEEGLDLIHRSDLLAHLLRGESAILVCGSHGKSSITALLAHVLVHGGLDPSFAIGAFCPNLPYHGRRGKGPFVVEADESDGSFVRYRGRGAIFANIDDDHLDYWKTKQHLINGFAQVAANLPDPSFLVWCSDDPTLSKLDLGGMSYGTTREADLQMLDPCQKGQKTFFKVRFCNRETSFSLPILGIHQALNSVSVIGMARLLGLSDHCIQSAFDSFCGTCRRLEKRGEARGILFYDDYAHHPKEITSSLEAIRKGWTQRRLVTIFEPHRYSRLHYFNASFVDALSLSDLLVVTDVYSAGETPIVGVTGEGFCELAKKRWGNNCFYAPFNQVSSSLLPLLQERDVVVTLGAGNSTRLCEELLEALG